jgi:hypothetical protein
MSNQFELFMKPPESAKAIVQTKEAIKKILERHRQPVAEKLLRELEKEIGWYVRHVYGQIIAEIVDLNSLFKNHPYAKMISASHLFLNINILSLVDNFT